MSGRNQRQSIRKDLDQALVRLRRDHLLALVGRGGDPDLAPEVRPASSASSRRSTGSAGASNLMSPATRTCGAPRTAAARRRPRCGRDKGRNAKQFADQPRRLAPAVERPFADPSVDQRERQTRPLHLDDHVRPQLGFGDERRVGPPMREKPAQEKRTVERNVLVQRAGRQALREERCRGDRSRRHQRDRAGPGDALDKGQKRRASPTLAPCSQTSCPAGR